MDFLTSKDVTEIIKAMIGQNAPHKELFTDYLKEAAKACVEADRILSGRADVEVNIQSSVNPVAPVSPGKPLDALADGIRALLDLLDEHKAIKQAEIAWMSSLDPETGARVRTEG